MSMGRRSGFVTMVAVLVIGTFSISLEGNASGRTLKPKEAEKTSGRTLKPKEAEKTSGRTLKPKEPSSATESTAAAEAAPSVAAPETEQASGSATGGAPAERVRCKKLLRDTCGKVKKGGGRLHCCIKQNESTLMASCPKVVAKLATNSKYRGLDSSCSTEDGAVNSGFESESSTEALPPEMN
jgi:hypothetical protein